MTEQHPITPPPELVQQWAKGARLLDRLATEAQWQQRFAQQAAQWGADQELEACREWLKYEAYMRASLDIRAARRPEPPSLKQQAIEALDHILSNSSTELGASTIRRALEALPDD
jgi:hypothetical protein